jgi:hypothetical protein
MLVDVRPLQEFVHTLMLLRHIFLHPVEVVSHIDVWAHNFAALWTPRQAHCFARDAIYHEVKQWCGVDSEFVACSALPVENAALCLCVAIRTEVCLQVKPVNA